MLWIVAGPTEELAVAGAAYHKLGVESYLDRLLTFKATPSGDTLILAAAEANGCSIELSLNDGTIAAHEVNACSTLCQLRRHVQPPVTHLRSGTSGTVATNNRPTGERGADSWC